MPARIGSMRYAMYAMPTRVMSAWASGGSDVVMLPIDDDS